jgi:hypothetical protein
MKYILAYATLLQAFLEALLAFGGAVMSLQQNKHQV